MKIVSLVLFFAVGLNFNAPLSNNTTAESDVERFKNQVYSVRMLIDGNSKYNAKIAFLVDMKIKSGKKRFFVYDLINDKILDQGIVAHGSGSETGVRGELKFSNTPNSKSTSLGRYSIDKKYKGNFGWAYKLHGLDETNNNAFNRAIVLHHYSAIPHEEQDYYISNSQGCPMVSEIFFKKIEKIIDSSRSNIILNIYY